MRITSYDEAAALDTQLWRIDVVLFNVIDGYIDGEYCTIGDGPHPFECYFDDLGEARAYAATFTRKDAEDALIQASNASGYDNVAVEVNELDGMNPGYVVACHEWMHGVDHRYWFDE